MTSGIHCQCDSGSCPHNPEGYVDNCKNDSKYYATIKRSGGRKGHYYLCGTCKKYFEKRNEIEDVSKID